MSAKFSITRHNPSWKAKIPLEDSKPERVFRRILEDLKIPFHSQIEDDFTIGGNLVCSIKGPHHKKQRQIEKDAWKRKLLEDEGFRVIDFWWWEVLEYPDVVKSIVLAYWMLHTVKR